MLQTQSDARRDAVELLGAIGGSEAMASLRQVAETESDERLRRVAQRTIREWS